MRYKKPMLTLLIGILLTFFVSSCSKNNYWKLIKTSANYNSYKNYLLKQKKPKHFKQALDTYFTLYSEAAPDSIYTENNNIHITTNSIGTVFFEGTPAPINKLEKLCYNFITDSTKTDSDKKTNDKVLNRIHIHIQINEHTNTKTAKGVFKAVSNVLNTYKNELTQQWYGTTFRETEDYKQKALEDVLYKAVIITR